MSFWSHPWGHVSGGSLLLALDAVLPMRLDHAAIQIQVPRFPHLDWLAALHSCP